MIVDLPTLGLRRGEVLCLSGGGYRAALFHLGALTRLNELGLLAGVETIGAAAGGSIVAALLAARVPWPLEGAFREWPEEVVEPMRAIARRNARARAMLRSPISGSAEEAALEERYARELAGEPRGGEGGQPRVVFGGAGMALGEMAAGEGAAAGLRWEIGDSVAGGYDATLVEGTIATVRTDLDAFGEAEQAVLENHGYLIADAAARGAGAAVEPLPPEPPHPRWMDQVRVRKALASSSRRKLFGRLRPKSLAGGRGARDQMGEEVASLLEEHRPIVQYDSLESYRADSVASIASLAMGRRCNGLHRADGTPIASVLPDEESGWATLDLDFLRQATYANGEPVRDDDYLDESGGAHAADALAMRRRQGCADVVYGRAARSGGATWLQYWFFYYYNDKGFLKLGLHEGDWEMVQLRLADGRQPDSATYAQHSGAVRASWDAVERRSADGGEAPVVYSARGSHASLLSAGTRAAPIVPDHNDGLGPAVRPRLVRIGAEEPAWVGWPGRWGATRRREAFEGSSPGGPARHPAWSDPAGFHAEARAAGGAAATGGEPPPAPSLRARIDGGSVVVVYRFPAVEDAARRPHWIVAAPLRPDSTDPPRTQTFKVDGQRGAFALQMPPDGGYEAVRLSAVSARGVPGETLTEPFVGSRREPTKGRERAG